MTPYQERYHALKAEGTCVTCKRREAMAGLTQCGACSEDAAARKAALKARRLKAGKCPHCGGEPMSGSKTCLVAKQCERVYHHRTQRIRPLREAA